MIASFGMIREPDDLWVWDCFSAGSILEDDGRITAKWDGYTVDFAGVVIDSEPTDNRPFTSNDDEIVELRIQRAFFEDCPVYAVILWDRVLGYRAGIHGLEEYRSKQDLTKTGWKCLDLLGHLNHQGRPLGSGHDVTQELVQKYFWQWVEEHGSEPRQDNKDFTRLFFLGTRQFKSRLSDAGIAWPPPRPE